METSMLIIGGYGRAGKQIAELLIRQKPKLKILLAGRSLEKAEKEARRINERFHSQNVSALRLDAMDRAALVSAFRNVDFIVNAASVIEQTSGMVEAVLESGKDYLDTQLSSPTKHEVLFRNADSLVNKDICFVTDAGFHPGLPAALVRYCASQMDAIQKGNVFGALRLNWATMGATKGTMMEFIDEFKHYRPSIYQEGIWQKQSPFKNHLFDFGEPFGREKCLPMFLEEMKILVGQVNGIRETGFYITGFNKFLDNWLLPIIYLGILTVPRKYAWPFVNLFLWGSKFTKPPYGVKLVSECAGSKDGQPLNIRIEMYDSDEYLLTAAPVVACLLQLLDGSIRQPGLWFASNLVKPKRFMSDLERMGAEYKIQHYGSMQLHPDLATVENSTHLNKYHNQKNPT